MARVTHFYHLFPKENPSRNFCFLPTSPQGGSLGFQMHFFFFKEKVSDTLGVGLVWFLFPVNYLIVCMPLFPHLLLPSTSWKSKANGRRFGYLGSLEKSSSLLGWVFLPEANLHPHSSRPRGIQKRKSSLRDTWGHKITNQKVPSTLRQGGSLRQQGRNCANLRWTVIQWWLKAIKPPRPPNIETI